MQRRPSFLACIPRSTLADSLERCIPIYVSLAIGARILDGFFSRLSIPDEWEQAYQAIEQTIREDGDAGDDEA
jgi:hypothetical protein